MFIFLKFLLLFLVISCGHEKTHIQETSGIAEEIKPHYESFIKEAQKRNVQLPLEKLKSAIVTEDPSFPLGRCQDGHVTINIKKTYGDICTLMVASYHEFGHCILNLPHTTDGKLHLMQPKMEPSCAIYLYYWDSLLDEIFFKLSSSYLNSQP
jgi:hypothetical protein